MKIVGNIKYIFKAMTCLRFLNEYKREIEDAHRKGDIEREKKNILLATSSWGKNFSNELKMNLEVSGRDNLPSDGPVVYMANHQGYADIIALCAVLDTIQTGFVAKDNLEKVPLYGSWIKRIRSVLLKRGDSRSALKTLNEAASLIKQGFSMVIFPEGRRSRSSEIAEFKKGAFKIATKPKVPIIPITIDGTWRVFEEKGKVQPANVKIHIHPPVETASLSKQEEKKLPDEIFATVASKLSEWQS